MRRLGLVAFCALSLAACATSQAPLTADDARHLSLRAEFGESPADLNRFAGLNRGEAIARILATSRTEAVTPAPGWVADSRDGYDRVGKMDASERAAWDRKISSEGSVLKAWWFEELLTTPSPITERMVMFWHNNFVTSFNTVRAPDLLYRQNQMFRRYALGDFRALLHAVARDPAMMKYLDTASSKKSGPNENFARELLELFTLGEGHYTEADIKQAARAFTGWRVDEKTGNFSVNQGERDTGAKLFLARQGNFTGDDIVDVILEQRRTAVFITEKLWREFVSDRPDPKTVDRLATVFYSDWDIKRLMSGLLNSDAFWDQANRGALVKGPAELLVGAMRSLKISNVAPNQLADLSRRLGQDLFEPPNVRGWPGGVAWINSDTLLQRRDAVSRLARGQQMKFDGWNIAAKSPLSPNETATEGLTRILLATEPVQAINPPRNAQLPAVVEMIMLDPAYQLK